MKMYIALMFFVSIQASDAIDYQTAVIEIIKNNRQQTIIDLKRRLAVVKDDIQEVAFLMVQRNPIDDLQVMNEILQRDKVSLEWMLKGMEKRKD